MPTGNDMIEKFVQSDDQLMKKKPYPRSTISEALCEIHFLSNEKYNQKKIDELKNILKDSYPDVNEEPIKYYHAVIEENRLSVKEETTQRTIFKHRERNHLLQIFPNMLTINEIGQYPNWDVFIDDIQLGYKSIKKVFSISRVDRVGLRYINLIPRKNREEALFNWLNTNKYYPDGILNNTKGFLSKCEFGLQNHHKLIVTISESLQNDSLGNIVFDIDVISTSFQQTDYESLRIHLDGLHAIASDVFHSSISQKYLAFLQGE